MPERAAELTVELEQHAERLAKLAQSKQSLKYKVLKLNKLKILIN